MSLKISMVKVILFFILGFIVATVLFYGGWDRMRVLHLEWDFDYGERQDCIFLWKPAGQNDDGSYTSKGTKVMCIKNNNIPGWQ